MSFFLLFLSLAVPCEIAVKADQDVDMQSLGSILLEFWWQLRVSSASDRKSEMEWGEEGEKAISMELIVLVRWINPTNFEFLSF